MEAILCLPKKESACGTLMASTCHISQNVHNESFTDPPFNFGMKIYRCSHWMIIFTLETFGNMLLKACPMAMC